MAEDQNAIQKLYADPKARGYINHLIGAYLPVHKSQKVCDYKKGQKPKYNVCGTKLISIGEVIGGMFKEDEKLRAEFAPFLLKSLNGEKTKVEDHPMYKHVTHGRILAWTGEKTDTCLCLTCIQDLLDLVQTGLLMDDKNIAWRVNKLQREGVFNHFQESPYLDDEEKKTAKDIEKRVERSQKKKVTTFADLGVLQELKAKMEQNEKEEE